MSDTETYTPIPAAPNDPRKGRAWKVAIAGVVILGSVLIGASLGGGGDPTPDVASNPVAPETETQCIDTARGSTLASSAQGNLEGAASALEDFDVATAAVFTAMAADDWEAIATTVVHVDPVMQAEAQAGSDHLLSASTSLTQADRAVSNGNLAEGTRLIKAANVDMQAAVGYIQSSTLLLQQTDLEAC